MPLLSLVSSNLCQAKVHRLPSTSIYLGSAPILLLRLSKIKHSKPCHVLYKFHTSTLAHIPQSPLFSSRNMETVSYHIPSLSNEDNGNQANHLNLVSSSYSTIPRHPSSTEEASQQNFHLSPIHQQCIATLSAHRSYISSLTIAGKFFYTGSADNEIRAWKRNPLHYEPDDEILADNVVAVGKGAVKSLVVLADKLFSAHQDHKIRVWKIKSHEPNNQKCERIATLPTLSDRTMKLFNPKNQVQIRRHKKCTWVHHVDTVSALALSRDESLLYSVSWDRTLKIWRTTDFKCLESINHAHDDAINAVALCDEGCIFTGSADKKIKVWRKDPAEKYHCLVATLEQHKSGINALALRADGCFLYSGAGDKSILVWERLDDDKMVTVGALRGHTKAILSITVSSNLIFSGSADKTIRVWRGVDKSYSCLTVLEGHQGPVKCLTVAAECYNNHDASSNYLVYSGSLDCNVKVWQIALPLH